MREPEPMGYYAIRDAENMPRVMHCVRSRSPGNAVEISADQAFAISQAYRTHGPRKKKPADENIVLAVLDECKDQIIAVVQEASAERDEALSQLMNRVATIERIIDALGAKADQILEKPQ